MTILWDWLTGVNIFVFQIFLHCGNTIFVNVTNLQCILRKYIYPRANFILDIKSFYKKIIT